MNAAFTLGLSIAAAAAGGAAGAALHSAVVCTEGAPSKGSKLLAE